MTGLVIDAIQNSVSGVIGACVARSADPVALEVQDTVLRDDDGDRAGDLVLRDQLLHRRADAGERRLRGERGHRAARTRTAMRLGFMATMCSRFTLQDVKACRDHAGRQKGVLRHAYNAAPHPQTTGLASRPATETERPITDVDAFDVLRTLAAGLAFVLLASSAEAAVRTWTGAASALRADAGNWGGTAPVAGDDLVFPVGALNRTNVNDLPADTLFNSVDFQTACVPTPYTVTGTPSSWGPAA